ncbi:MAG: hypothetical protein J6A73_04300 [Lachnospiraceae bacterium]|nr:hypothetical protein [Lachnospiraceae bacterium]
MKRDRKKIIFTVTAGVTLIILLLACIKIFHLNSVSKEQRILFVMAITDVTETTEMICVDNEGKMYSLFPKEKIVNQISDGSIYKEKVVGHVSKIKLDYYYDKFCQLDEEMFLEARGGGGNDFSLYFSYYGVNYAGDSPELVKLGDTTYYADDPDAEDIVQWMKKWNYR